MSDLQIRDIVETNEYARDIVRNEVIVSGHTITETTTYFIAGERGVVVGVGRDEGDSTLIDVEFADGTQDTIYADCLDLVYRPINDPALYDRSLLDLIEWNSVTDHDKAMIYADMVEEKHNHLSGYGE